MIPPSAAHQVCFAALLPHAPVLVPEVGGARCAEVSQTIAGMRKVARACLATRPEALVLISPHSPRRRSAFGLWAGKGLEGSLAQFRAPDARLSLPADEPLRDAIAAEAGRHGLETWTIPQDGLDHGAVVPLWFLAEAGWDGPTVILSLNDPGEGGCVDLGEAIAGAAEKLGRRTAVVASGDMSHRLRPGAPAGYHPAAHESDEHFIEILKGRDAAELLDFDHELLSVAAEDALDSTIVALGAAHWRSEGREVLSYEGPFGVGYGVAILYSETQHGQHGDLLPAVARRSVEAALSGSASGADQLPGGSPFHASMAGVFVTLRTIEGELRGCVGTLEPRCGNVVEETWRNARSAAFRDHRFEQVEAFELDELVFEVSVLEPAEDVESEQDLNPQVYGVIVSAGLARRGVLLPGIEGVATAAEQIAIARRKAGIGAEENVRLQRFRMTKYVEARTQLTGGGKLTWARN